MRLHELLLVNLYGFSLTLIVAKLTTWFIPVNVHLETFIGVCLCEGQMKKHDEGLILGALLHAIDLVCHMFVFWISREENTSSTFYLPPPPPGERSCFQVTI